MNKLCMLDLRCCVFVRKTLQSMEQVYFAILGPKWNPPSNPAFTASRSHGQNVSIGWLDSFALFFFSFQVKAPSQTSKDYCAPPMVCL